MIPNTIPNRLLDYLTEVEEITRTSYKTRTEYTADLKYFELQRLADAGYIRIEPSWTGGQLEPSRCSVWILERGLRAVGHW